MDFSRIERVEATIAKQRAWLKSIVRIYPLRLLSEVVHGASYYGLGSTSSLDLLISKRVLGYKRFYSHAGGSFLGLFLVPDSGTNAVYQLYGSQPEELVKPKIVTNHEDAKLRMKNYFEGLGYEVLEEYVVEYIEEKHGKRLKRTARWDLYVPEIKLVIEIETGGNEGSLCVGHIRAAMHTKNDIWLVSPEQWQPTIAHANYLTSCAWRALSYARNLPQMKISILYDVHVLREILVSSRPVLRNLEIPDRLYMTKNIPDDIIENESALRTYFKEEGMLRYIPCHLPSHDKLERIQGQIDDDFEDSYDEYPQHFLR